jgi:glycerate 2-kinase
MRIPPPPPDEAGLRNDALLILRAALEGVEPEAMVHHALAGGKAPRETITPANAVGSAPSPSEALGSLVTVARHSGAPLRLVSIGKAAIPMARGALRAISEDVPVQGMVLAPRGATTGPSSMPTGLPATIRVLEGGHPVPTVEGQHATHAILSFIRAGSGSSPFLVLLSGGGSALLSSPAGNVSMEDLRITTRLLLASGAAIQDINAVRKHLELAKGGNLGKAAYPSPVLGLVLSDVMGNPLDVIASGPLSPDPTTFSDALRILHDFRLANRVPEVVRLHLEEGREGMREETPGPGDASLANVQTIVIGDNSTAASAAARAARSRGYRVHLLSTRLSGEARSAGKTLAGMVRSIRAGLGRHAFPLNTGGMDDRPPLCLITGGETTVTVRGDGLGGRNQELVLSAAQGIDGEPEVLIASMGTDGVDGPTDAAGALATGSTIGRAAAAGLDPDAALCNNDSHPFFRALDDLLVTGPTGTNVMDLQVTLIR